MNQRRTTPWAAAQAAAIGLALLAGSEAAAQEPLRIGTLFSATGGGAILTYSAQAAANLAADEINKKGGILGRRVELSPADDQSDPAIALLEAKRLIIDRKVDAILGPLGSLTTLPVAPVLTDAKIANFSVAQAKQLTPELAPFHFTLVVNTDEIAKVYIRFAVERLKATKIAVLVDKTAGQRALLDSFKAVIAEFPSAKIVAVQEFELGTSDQIPQILSLRGANPDVILHSSLTGPDAGASLKAMQDIDWNVPIVLSTSAINALPAVLAVTGADGVSANNIFAWDYKSLTYCSGDAVGESPLAKFNQRMRAFAPSLAPKVAATNALWIYDAFYFLKAAMEGSGGTDGRKIADWLENNASSLEGVLGKPTASKANHFMFGADALSVVENIGKVREDGLRKRSGC